MAVPQHSHDLSSGEVSRFVSGPLRELSERAFAQARGNELDARGLIASLEGEPLRLRLLHAFEEAERGRAPSLEEQLKKLQPVLHKHEQKARQLEELRKHARLAKVPREPA